ncbi:protein of unknown function [Cyanobium sp. NIES-981]|nr:protein of unknown function [Cyanobium sp. NIES-981]
MEPELFPCAHAAGRGGAVCRCGLQQWKEVVAGAGCRAVRGGRRQEAQWEGVSPALFLSSLWTELCLVPTAACELPNSSIL